MLKNNRAIIIHGGGLVDCSKQVLMRLAEEFSEICNKVFIGYFSFESLYKKEYWDEYNLDLVQKVKNKRGTWFGTCREIFLEGEKLEKAITLLKSEGVNIIVVCGGDGSSRQVAEMHEAFENEGIHIVFPMPLTIDGINGGASIGIEQAVRESIRQIENMAATSLQTKDNEKFGVLCAELQGRNRDDITFETLNAFKNAGRVADFDLSDLFVVVVPTTMETDEEKLFKAINSSENRTLVLLSEGAKIKIADIKKNVSRKIRTLVVGHQSQSNNQTTDVDIDFIDSWIANAMWLIKSHLGKSICIVWDKDDDYYHAESIDYYASKNPRNGQKCALTDKQEKVLKEYVIA